MEHSGTSALPAGARDGLRGFTSQECVDGHAGVARGHPHLIVGVLEVLEEVVRVPVAPNSFADKPVSAVVDGTKTGQAPGGSQPAVPRIFPMIHPALGSRSDVAGRWKF